MMKRLLTMTIALLSVLGVWADETTIYERKASDVELSGSTSAMQVRALWSTKDIYNSTDETTAGGWTLVGTPANVTAAIDGGLKLEGNNGNNKSQEFTYSKAISVSSNTSILRLTADWNFSKNRAGNSGDVSYYSFLRIGDVEIRFTGKDYKMITVCNGTTIQTEAINTAYFNEGAYANLSVTIDQSLKTVSYTINIYKSTSDPSPLVKTNTGTTGESVTYNLSAGYSKAGGGSATTDIIKNIKVTEEAQDVTLYSYTVNYKVGENVVKTVTSSLAEGSAIPVLTALDGEGDYTGNHYLISAEEAPSWTILSTVAENTHDVEVRAPYSTTLTVTRNFDGVAEATPYIDGQALVETDDKVANWVYTFPYYVQNDEKWYRATLKDEKYGEEGTFTTEAINKTIDYTLDNTVVYFWDYSHNNYVNNINYSGGSKNDFQQGQTIGSLEAGIYEITVMQDASYSAKLYKDYTDSNNPGSELLTFDNSNRTRVLTLKETTNNVQIASSGNSRYDYVLVRKLKYTLTSNATNGTIVMKKDNAEGADITSGSEVDRGTTIYVSATPNDGYYLASLTKKEGDADAASFENGTKFTLQDATTITATFTAKTAPTIENLAAETLTYTGVAQNLVTTPTVTGGTISYSTTENGEYSATIPQGTAAGDYTVWYKVTGDATHTDIAATQVENVKINKATISPSVSITGWTAGETANDPSVTGNTDNGAVTYTYKVKDADDGTYSETVPTEAGEYTVKATIAATTNYEGNTATANFTITAATPTYTITLPSAVKGNSVGASKTEAINENEEITLTVTLATGYKLTELKYNDTAIEIVENQLSYTFNMPAANVTVTAKYGKVETQESGDEEVNETISVIDDTHAEVTTVTVSSETTEIAIPASVDGVPVTSIAEDAFENVANKEEIKSVDLSETSISGVVVVRNSGVFKDFPDEAIIYMPAGNTAATGQKNVVIKDGSGNLVCADFEMVGTEVTGSTDKGKSYNIPKDFKANKVTLNREFTTDTYCTVCLPYAMSETAASAVGKFYYFSGISGTNVQMTEKTGGLDANTPYIFKPSSNASNISETNGSGITVSMAADPKTANGTFTFQGAFEYKKFTTEEIASGIYGFAADTEHGATSVGQFVKAENGAWIQGMRGYLKYDGTLDGAAATSRGMESGEALPDALNVVLVNADGSTTNIGRLELIDTDDDTPRYNLSGQRVSKSYKGIVIINGKKVIIK